MNFYTHPHAISALQAKSDAMKLAFSPMVFQATYALWSSGILKAISEAGETGISTEALADKFAISLYGVQVLLDVGLSARLIWQKDDRYVLDKTGYFFLSDELVKVNFEFVHSCCYEAMGHLMEAIQTERPAGLKVLGDWPTVYEGLSELPEPAKSSWFAFDHYASDKAFPELLPILFEHPVKQLYDVGGNTGKWALACLRYDPQVQVSILDLPQQLALAGETIQQANLNDRYRGIPINLLDKTAALPAGADAICMNQFLDCFSETEIVSILSRAANSMGENTRLYILELFWDRQGFEAAAFSINCISLYFTAIANGNSRMYHSGDFLRLVQQAGLIIDREVDQIGLGHTLLCCKRALSS